MKKLKEFKPQEHRYREKRASSSPLRKEDKIALGVIFCMAFLGWQLFSDGDTKSEPAPKELASPEATTTQSPAESITANSVANSPALDSWIPDFSTSQMDGSATVSLHTPSITMIDGFPDKHERPVFNIRCKENKTEVIFYTKMESSVEDTEGHHTVELRIDEKRPYKERWRASTDGEALFAPNSVALSKKLAQSSKLTIRFTPFNASPQIAIFELYGLDKHLGNVANACGWSYRATSPNPTMAKPSAAITDPSAPLSHDEVVDLCRKRVLKQLKSATVTFDENDRQVMDWKGEKQAFGKAVVSTDKKRQFRTFLCSVRGREITFFKIDAAK